MSESSLLAAPVGAAPALAPAARPLTAFVWMLGAIASFTAMAVAGREIQVEMNTFELMLYRSGIGFAVIAALILASGRAREIVATRHIRLHLVRNAAHYTGQNLWFFAVMLIPLGQLAALEFTNPIWVVLLAPFLLGEAMTPARLVAAALGFAGVLIVAQPGAAPFGIGHAAALAAGLAFALNTLFTRRIMNFDAVLCVLFWMTLMQGLASLVLSLPGGIPLPSATTFPWIVVVGVTGLTAHYCLTSALGCAPASVVAPMEFLRLPIVAIVGMLVYHEPLRLSIFVGATVIIAGNLVGLRAAARRRPG